MINLIDCGVAFEQEAHTYHLAGKQLTGITKRIQQRICPDEYARVSDAVLEAAATRGHIVHAAIEKLDKEGYMPDFMDVADEPNLSAVAIYAEARAKVGLTTVANEHLCTDGHTYATSIDAVMTTDGDDVILADYKTVSSLNREKVSWQLSTEAYFLEMNNPGLKVGKLYAVWLKHTGDVFTDCAFIELPRKSAELVEKMLYTEEDLGGDINTLIAAYVVAAAAKRLADAEEEQARAAIQAYMVEHAMTAAKNDDATISYKAAGVRRTFDSKRFQKEHEDIYNEYLTETATKPTVSIRLKQ